MQDRFGQIDYGLTMAASVIASLPLVIITLIFQRYIVQGTCRRSGERIDEKIKLYYTVIFNCRMRAIRQKAGIRTKRYRVSSSGAGRRSGFLPSGKLRSAFLSRNTTIRGITYKSNTTAKFYDTGVCRKGRSCRSGRTSTGFYFTKWAFVRHNTNGNSRDYYGSAILTVDKTVAGLPLKKGAFVVFGRNRIPSARASVR